MHIMQQYALDIDIHLQLTVNFFNTMLKRVLFIVKSPKCRLGCLVFQRRPRFKPFLEVEQPGLCGWLEFYGMACKERPVSYGNGNVHILEVYIYLCLRC